MRYLCGIRKAFKMKNIVSAIILALAAVFMAA